MKSNHLERHKNIRTIIKRYFLLFFFLLISINIYCQDRAEFQLIIPAPDPVQAGEKISFQIIVLNSGKETWSRGSLEIEVEIYDSEKKYLTKTEKVSSDIDVVKGETYLGIAKFDIPSGFAGKYLFRVSAFRNKIRIAYSDFLPFSVTPVEVKPEVPSKFKLGGNAIISYKNDSNNDWKNYLGSLSLNLIGSIYNGSFVSNLNTYHSRNKPVDIYNVVFDYYGSIIDFHAGDVMPYFGVLSLSNSGMRGVLPVFKKGKFSSSIIGAKTQDAKEGEGIVPVYARYLYGISTKFDFSYNKNINLTYVESSDNVKSLKTQAGITPLKNQVIGLGFNFDIFENLSIETEFATSKNSTDTITNISTVDDTAYRIRFEFIKGNFSLNAGHQMVNPDFNALGSPTIVKDRTTQDLMINTNIGSFGNLSLSYMGNSDNVKSDPAKLTTFQKIYSISSGLKIPVIQNINFGYSLNEIKDKTLAEINNFTDTLFAGISISKVIKKCNFLISLNTQQSGFKDKVRTENATKTLSLNFGVAFNLQNIFSINLGINSTVITDIFDSSLNKLNTISITGNYYLLKDKLVLTFFANSFSRNDNDLISPVITDSINYNMEITYYWTNKFSVTIGSGENMQKDTLVSSNNKSETRFNIRAGISF